MSNAIYRYIRGCQNWANYPQSPVLTNPFLWEAIIEYPEPSLSTQLWVSSQPFWHENYNQYYDAYHSLGYGHIFTLTNGTWVMTSTFADNEWNIILSKSWELIEANMDIYADSSFSSTYFGATINYVLAGRQRIRNIRHKNTGWIRDRFIKFWDTVWKRVNL